MTLLQFPLSLLPLLLLAAPCAAPWLTGVCSQRAASSAHAFPIVLWHDVYVIQM